MPKDTYIMFVVLTIMIILACLALQYTTCKIPKRIWTYWDGDMSLLVHMCLQSCLRHNRDYDIILLTRANLHKYIDIDLTSLRHANFGHAMFSDFVRLHVLAKHGGIWMDASVICNKSLDWMRDIQKTTGRTFVGYKANNHTEEDMKGVRDVIETSVFACTPNNPFVCAWRDEFMKINDYEHVHQYIDDMMKQGFRLPSITRNEYWAVYSAYCVTLERNPDFNKHMYLMDATKTIYVYQFENGHLSHHEQVASLFTCKYRDQPLLKLSNWDRAAIQTNHADISGMFCPDER